MSHDDDRDWAEEVTCRNCGARNPATAVRCASCGMPLPGTDFDPISETVIDVSSEQPRIVVHDDDDPAAAWPDTVRTIRFDGGRVVVARGGRRTCLIIVVIFALLSCCVCVVFWNGIVAMF